MSVVLLSDEIIPQLDAIVSHYSAWRMMLDRCQNPRNKRYADYGGRGITVCARWQSFAAFIVDVGLRPDVKHSLERKNNNAGYYKSNCKWATKQEQNDNRRDTILVNGEPLSYWVRVTGLKRSTLDRRLRAGWPIERVLHPTKQKTGPKAQHEGELQCL